METDSQLAVSHQKAPVEVWELILGYATYLPKELGIAEWTESYDPLELGRNYVPPFAASSSDVRIEIRNRYSLSLVSPSWNTTLLGTLYRSIFINDIVRLQQFHRLIATRPNITPLIRRIDVGNIYRHEYNDATTLLNEIIEVCPNIVYMRDVRVTPGNFINRFIGYGN